MKKTNYFRIGAMAYMLLGLIHLVAQMSIESVDENVLQVLIKMKDTSFDFMGEHNLMQFYNGFSITMGFMLFAFGLQAFLIDRPTKRIVFVDIVISAIVIILSYIYFHPLAYLFIAFAMICFSIRFFEITKEIKD